MRQGDNRTLIEMICKRLPCQVGGGLKTPEDGQRCSPPEPSASSTAPASSANRTSASTRPSPPASRKPSAKTSSSSPSTPKAAKSPSRAGRTPSPSRPKRPSPGSKTTAPPSSTPTSTRRHHAGFPMNIAAILRSTTARQLIVAGGIKERNRDRRARRHGRRRRRWNGRLLRSNGGLDPRAMVPTAALLFVIPEGNLRFSISRLSRADRYYSGWSAIA
jgi:hypothetical protein